MGITNWLSAQIIIQKTIIEFLEVYRFWPIFIDVDPKHLEYLDF